MSGFDPAWGEAGLREAAQALVDEVDAYIAGDRPLDGHYLRQALERLRAALLASDKPGLDVERHCRTCHQREEVDGHGVCCCAAAARLNGGSDD